MKGLWRRIGVLVPSINTVAERELIRMLPPQTSLHFERLLAVPDIAQPNVVRRLESDLERAVMSLSSANVGVYAFACTSGSFIDGKKWNDSIKKRISRLTRRPATTAAGSILEALRKIKAKSVEVFTPYPKSTNSSLKCFLNEEGYDIELLERLPFKNTEEIGNFSEQKLLGFVESRHTHSDCILISCTNLPTFSILQKLERIVQIPVVSSNQALMWHSLRTIGVRDKIEGYGELLLR